MVKIIEIQGHSMSDPGVSYRTREEVMEVRQSRDPLLLLQQYLEQFGLFDEKELKVTYPNLS